MRVAALLATILIFGNSCRSVPNGFVPGKALAGREAAKFGKLCSRPGIGRIDGTWELSPDVVRSLESNLWRIREIRAMKCCVRYSRIEHPERYSREYVGVVVGKKRLIYVAASEDGSFDVCDGGDAYWGAFYDPMEARFFDLAVNGIG